MGKGGDLCSSLGTFGGRHLDGYDSASSLTAMTNLSLLPPQIHPGYFYLYELGVCWELLPISTIIFSGLRWHGGCSPTHTAHFNPPPDAYRLCLIAYPPSSVVDGGTEAAFAAVPDKRGGLFTIPREVTARPYHQQWRSKCEHANYVQDGASLMARSRHVEFIARTLLQLVLFFLAQLPTVYQGLRLHAQFQVLSLLTLGMQKKCLLVMVEGRLQVSVDVEGSMPWH